MIEKIMESARILENKGKKALGHISDNAKEYALSTALAAGIGLGAQNAQAANALDDIPLNSQPTTYFATPYNPSTFDLIYGEFTGGDGKIDSSTIVTSNHDAVKGRNHLLWFDMNDASIHDGDPYTNPSPTQAIEVFLESGRPMTGVAYGPNDTLFVSFDNNIYQGTVSGGQFNVTKTIMSDGWSGAKDVDYALDAVFTPTDNGIRKIDGSGNSSVVQSVSSGTRAYDVLEFDEFYDHSVGQVGGEVFNSLDGGGFFLSGAQHVAGTELNNSSAIEGIAYTNNSMAVIQDVYIDVHQPFAFQEHMIPETATGLSAMLALGALGAVSRKRNYDSNKNE